MGKDTKYERELYENIIKSGECFKLSDMKLSGKDLAEIGVFGRKTGEILEKALDAVMKGEIPNEREALLSFSVKLK